LKGDKGDTGDAGAQGIQGLKGDDGIIAKFLNLGSVTGVTTNVLITGILIPANTWLANDFMSILIKAKKSGSSGTFTIRLYINSVNSLTGATVISFYLSTASALAVGFVRNMPIIGSVLNHWHTSVSALTDMAAMTTANEQQTAFNVASDMYILVAIQNSTVFDTTSVNALIIKKS
jgi:hypothetical protein